MQYDTDETRTLATLGRLTRGALHELSNPLVALLGSAELALNDVEPGTKLHDRIALTQRTGAEVVEIVRALQAFVRLQSQPPEELSVGQAAADAVALVTRVMPTHDVELRASGDATTVAGPGEIRRRLVELLVAALDAQQPRARSSWSSPTASSPRRAAASCGSSSGAARPAGRRAARPRPRRPPTRRRSRPRRAFPGTALAAGRYAYAIERSTV